MKPVHVAVLVVGGALAGAAVMGVWLRPRAAHAPAPVTAQVRQPAAVPAAPPAAIETPAQPAPVSAPMAAPAVPVEKPDVRKQASAKPAVSSAATIVNPQPASAPAAPPPAAPPETPNEAPVSSPPPPVTPPARTEPEHATPPPPPPPPEPHRVTLNAGLLLPVRLVDGLSSERNAPGDTFTATLEKELVVDGFVIAERGARVDGRVVASDRGGKVRGVSGLAVELTAIHTSDGQNVAIRTDSFERHAEGTRNQDAAKVGGGAAVGAIIGAIAGGGKGAAVGAGVGGAAGAGGVLLTRGKPATLPSETRLNFRLSAPVTITEKIYR